MASFNSMPGMTPGMTPGNPAVDHMALDGGIPNGLPMDHFDPGITFDDALLDSGALPTLPFNAGYDFDSFATFEDPFSPYQTRHFPPVPKPDPMNEESSPEQLDNKLLGFSDPIPSATVIDESGSLADLQMSAELYGMFFVAEDVFGGEGSGRPMELTCYRRNLWQCSGQISLPRVVPGILNDQNQQIPISELFASITGMESIEGKATEIISIPWKSANPQGGDDAKVAGPPPNIAIDLSSGQELDANRVSVPLSWKRLQFKHATANNGRRKGLQQHYIVHIALWGKTKTGEVVKISEIQSGPVIVRGRSPRNFDNRKDVPLASDKKLERKNTAGSDTPNLKQEPQTAASRTPSVSQQPNDWATPHAYAQANQSPHPAKKVALTPTITKPPIPSWSNNLTSPPVVAQATTQRGTGVRPSVPINLSLSDDGSPNRSSVDIMSPNQSKGAVGLGLNAASSPAEDADPLYEYFPLTVDDWMPPVDAVYRPHVVHHTIVPPEMKAQQVQKRNKRYFLPE